MIVEWITLLESGRQFRKWVSILLKFLGVLVLVGTIVLGMIFIDDPGYSFIGAILGLCINFVIGIVLLMLFWNRPAAVISLDLSQGRQAINALFFCSL